MKTARVDRRIADSLRQAAKEAELDWDDFFFIPPEESECDDQGDGNDDCGPWYEWPDCDWPNDSMD